MVIFETYEDASIYADKIHKYLNENRPGYTASYWTIPERAADSSLWMVKEPPEEFNQLWEIPIDTSVEKSVAIGTTNVLPDVGQECIIDEFYLYKGDVIKCRQTHNRTIYEPSDTPALFSFFRDNSDSLQWIVGEQVEVGWMRIYEDIKYEVIQAHQTQADWTPVLTLGTLWKVYVDPATTSEWQIGVEYIIGQTVTYLGNTYECLQAHTSQAGWTPDVVPALWQLK